MNFAHFFQTFLNLAHGLPITLCYSIIPLIAGFTLGTCLTLLRMQSIPFASSFVVAYVSLFRGTPLIVQLSLLFFGAPAVLGIKLSAFTAGIITFSLNSAAYVSEIIRGGIEGVDRGQYEAAQALSIPYWTMMRHIILPQALTNILPALVSEGINLVKESAIISVIGVTDLWRLAEITSAQTFDFLGARLAAALWYYLIVLALSYFGAWLENRLQQKESCS